MKQRLNHFFVYTILANIFVFITVITAVIHAVSVKVTWLILIGLSIYIYGYYSDGKSIADFLKIDENIATLVVITALIAYNFLQPRLVDLFSWIIRKLAYDQTSDTALE